MSIKAFTMRSNVEQNITDLKIGQWFESYFDKRPLKSFTFIFIMNKNRRNAKINLKISPTIYSIDFFFYEEVETIVKGYRVGIYFLEYKVEILKRIIS